MIEALAGSPDVDHAAAALAARLPAQLAPFARLAYNYRWSWSPAGDELFSLLDDRRWDLCARNPVRLLQEASPEAIERAAADAELVGRAAALETQVAADLRRPALERPGAFSPARPIAYFSAEYAVHASLPVYSGGLGALAGDILKESSDLALPLVAVGLLYRQGYFRQRIDAGGWQHEYWVDTDPDRAPAALVRGEDGEPVTVTVPIGDRQVVAQAWRVNVGRIPLLLLDAERPENDLQSRWITSRLYISDPQVRLAQYLLLGVGGMRLLAALGIDPGVVHLNEGHAAFAALELMRQQGKGLEDALPAVRAHTVFTTHTPVPAGNDTYPAEPVAHALAQITGDLGTTPEALIRLGRTRAEDAGEPFGVTQFALRTSRTAIGVSRRHGEVAREMWHGLWPERPVEEVPIGHVTNGVHLPTWLGRPMRDLLDRHLGDDWLVRAADPATWEPLDRVSDAELWEARNAQRSDMVQYVRRRAVIDRLGRDEPAPYVDLAANGFDPEALTLGFARRLATYKRMSLLFSDPSRALALLGGDRPVQIVMAGKAHPRDDDGKRQVQALFSLKHSPGVSGRVVYLDDYDLTMAAHLVRGCDVWVNLPRPPLEASGTSGMKNIVNGGLHLSVLDGWWAEGYAGDNGWPLPGEVDGDHGAQDWRDGQELYRLLESELVPEFHDRGEDGVPAAWVARIRNSLRSLAPQFSATRMVTGYVEDLYTP